ELEAAEAINKLFADTSVGVQETRSSLDSIRGEISVLIESLDCDIEPED
ncbi:hypothetical protein LCGC14_3168220, partial [marine sediment metagenome]